MRKGSGCSPPGTIRYGERVKANITTPYSTSWIHRPQPETKPHNPPQGTSPIHRPTFTYVIIIEAAKRLSENFHYLTILLSRR